MRPTPQQVEQALATLFSNDILFSLKLRDDEDSWHISSFRIQEPMQRHGYGSMVLDALCTCADRCGVTLTLSYDHTKPWLRHWYQRHGFIWRRGSLMGKYWMEREPGDL